MSDTAYIQPSDEPAIESRLRAIESEASLGYSSKAADTAFASTTALTLLKARQATRASIAETAVHLELAEKENARLTKLVNMNLHQLIPQGPWYVCRPIAQCIEDGRTHLARNPADGWIAINGQDPAWFGSHQLALELAKQHGGNAVPAGWVDVRFSPREWKDTETGIVHSLKAAAKQRIHPHTTALRNLLITLEAQGYHRAPHLQTPIREARESLRLDNPKLGAIDL